LLVFGLVLLGVAVAIFSPRFANTIIRISANPAMAHRKAKVRPLKRGSRQRALRWKEFMLLRRDPWLMKVSPRRE
jgi:ABC-2 type transport system permease protein